MTETCDYADVIDALAEAGMVPVETDAFDELCPEWVKPAVWDAWKPSLAGLQLVLARHADDEVHVQVCTKTGVIFEELRFSVTRTGLRMLKGAVSAV